MFVGFWGRPDVPLYPPKGEAYKLISWVDVRHPQIRLWADPSVTLWPSDRGVLLLDGLIYEAPGLPGPDQIGTWLWEGIAAQGAEFLSRVNGDFTIFFWDASAGTALWAVDRMGVGKLFYGQGGGDGIVFGNTLGAVARLSGGKPAIHGPALHKILAFNYNPGQETLIQGLSRLRGGHALTVQKGRESVTRYWQLRFRPDEAMEAAQSIRDQLAAAVKRRMTALGRPGAFLSGGLDSSSVVSLLHRHGAQDLQTYSFRCRGESFDESPYARKVSEAFGTTMHLVEYGPEEALLAAEMVALMDEPFSDVGINVGTYLLAKAASSGAQSLFTGDGGDELFAGHPVYTADNMAKFTDRFPRFLLWPLFLLGRVLPDSDQKKDWRVKIKRFSESMAYPAALGTHRWRVYYTPRALRGLLRPEWAQSLDEKALFADLIGYNREGEGADALSRSLYSDYQTAVQFYLRRMDMARALGLSPRFPMLDPELVAFCATVPSGLKIRGLSDTKYIERVAVEPLLPYDVVHRKDKLGHSIPLKNWMRDNPAVIDFMNQTLLDGSLEARGWFNMDRVRAMISEHQGRKTNNSHRLWSLMILELWCRRHLDEA